MATQDAEIHQSHVQRKEEHLDICLNEDVGSGVATDLEHLRLIHQALPELDLDQVDLSTTFLGHALSAPILISAMTGGSERAAAINRRLATVAQANGVAMGLGSQRAGIEDPQAMATFQVRDVAPDILLLANLGAVQLNYGYGLAECQRAVDAVDADALVLHLNPLQEALQTGGNTNFSRLAERIALVAGALSVPLIVKEVGWGLSLRAALLLRDAGVACLDVGGAGGTSWSQVERFRAGSEADAEVAQAFRGWGIPTAQSLIAISNAMPDMPLIASGGISDGVQMAKALALGAALVGIARPFLRPATESVEAVAGQLDIIRRQLRIAMFCAGAADLARLDRSCLAYAYPRGDARGS